MSAKTPEAKKTTKKRGGFREAALLTKLEKLNAESKSDKMVKEIESRVPADELPAWLFSVYSRAVLPDHWALSELVARHVDGVPMDTLCAALTSEAVTHDAALYLPGIAARSQNLLFTACSEGKAEYLRQHVEEMPDALKRATWAALAGSKAKMELPPGVKEEVRELLPDHVLSGRMHGLELGRVLNWFGISAEEIYEPVASRLDEAKKIHLLTFGCVLFRMPKDELLRLRDRIQIDNMQPSWLDWWMGRRRDLVDSPTDNLAVFEAIRPILKKSPAWMRNTSLDYMSLGVAKALVAAGEPVPEWLLEIESDSNNFVERWMPVYQSLPAERVRALRTKLESKLEGYRKMYLMPLAGLLGEKEVKAALAQTEATLMSSNGVVNSETGLLGAIGRPVVEPLRARLDELTALLPQGVNPYGSDYKKFATVTGLRSSLAIALGKMAESGEDIDPSFDETLMPTPAVYGAHHDDHVYRFFMSNAHEMQKLFGALPEDRLRRFIREWLAYDKSGKHHILDRLKRVIPEARHGLLQEGPSQVERLRKLAAETGLPCTTAIYALTRDETRRKGSLNTIGASPLGLGEEDWPMAGKKKMEPVFSLDLSEIPELQAQWPWARALAFFVDRPEEGFRDSALLRLKEAQIAAGFSDEGSSFTIEKILIPEEVFGPRKQMNNEALAALREGIGVLPARALGMPFFIQEAGAYESGEGFILQAGESFCRLNLGDAGELYVFAGRSFWQCH